MKASETKKKAPKILLFGPYGSGKTCFATTAGACTQILDLDQGLNSVLSLKDKFSTARGEVDVLEAHENEPDRALAFMKARSYIQSIASQCRKGTYPFKILVIDSLTNLHEYGMRMLLANSGLLGQKPRIQDWMMRDIEFLNICIILKSLPIAVVLTAHQQVVEQDETMVVTPFLPGKSLPPNLISKFDEVLYMKSVLVAGGLTDFIVQNVSTTSVRVRTRANFPNNFNSNEGLAKLLELMGYNVKE